MSTSNVYSVLSDTVSLGKLDLNNYDHQEKVHYIPFDLAQLRRRLGTEPIFTTDLLRRIRDQKFAIQSELQKAPHHRKSFEFSHKTQFGTYRVWDDAEDDDDEDTEDEFNRVSIHFMSRVELHPGFQANFGKFSKTNRILRVNNDLQGKKNWMPVPYVIVAETLAYSKDHKSKTIMQGYWHALQNTAQLWLKSSSRLKILQMADEMALRLEPITKIVCFGLGAITHDKAFYESSLQHMTAFSIAERLKKAYRDKYSHETPVEIILQDPCYTQKDYELLNKMYSGGPLTFVSDPDGNLAIDANTIVLTAFLPVTYPLMQVITDLFHDKEGEGPAAIICDSMDLNPAQQLYALVDRASPEVARFLTKEYSVSDFKDHVLEPELAEDVSGGEGASRPYWLSRMQAYMRRDREMQWGNSAVIHD